MAPSELLAAEPARRHRLIAADFGRRVHGTRDWSAAAPVSGWEARDVVTHLVEWLPSFVAGGSEARLPEVPSPADEPAAAWDAHRRAVQDLLDDPARAASPFTNPHIGAMPLGDAIDRFYTSDVFLHTWDLARATGQDETLDPELCGAAMAMVEASISDDIRSTQPGAPFGPKVDCADSAAPHERLVAFLGRHP